MPAPDQDSPRPGAGAGQGTPGPDPGSTPLPPGRDPGGKLAYLPPRAARARKLILRSQLGRGWILAAALFGVVILAAGGLFLVRGGRPGAPWVRVAPLSALPAGEVTQVPGPSGQVVVADRRDGQLRAFLTAPGPCPVQGADGGGFARPCTGQHWAADGLPTDGRQAPPPLRRIPASFANGALYINPS